MDLREVFATNLRRWRNARGLSQDDLAYEAGVSRSYLSQLENGALSTPERNYIGGRSKNTSQAEMEGWFSSVTSKLSFPVRSMSLLSRPDRLPRATARSVGDGRSGATRSTASMASTGPSPQ